MHTTLVSLLLGIPAALLGILLPVAAIIALQVWLCKRRSRWFGLILPALSLISSLVLAGSLLAVSTMTAGGSYQVTDGHGNPVEHHQESTVQFHPRSAAAAGGLFLMGNIPTVVLGGIWLHYRNRQVFREEMDRMNLQDLE